MKRFFVEENGEEAAVFPYDPSKHRGRKFLYFVAPDGVETLLVSNSSRHANVFKSYNQFNNNVPLDEADLRGAGNLDRAGDVEDWFSSGFRLRTPEELRPRVLELLVLPV